MDTSVYHALNNFAFEHAFVGDLAKFFAQYAVFVLVGAVAVLWLARNRSGLLMAERTRLALLAAGLSTILALVIVQVIGHIWDRQRPFVVLSEYHKLIPHPKDASFPSDHASGSFAIFFALAFFGRRTLAGVALLMAILIGTARVMVGVHWPTDILGAFGVGALAATIVCSPQARGGLDWLQRTSTDLYERLLPGALRPAARRPALR